MADSNGASPSLAELHALLEDAFQGKEPARDSLEGWIRNRSHRASAHELYPLVEKAFEKDAGSVERLDAWFLRVRNALMHSARLRRDLESLATLITIRIAGKKLDRKYQDLMNDPASVASRLWEKRLHSFVEGLEDGNFDKYLQFVRWIDTATENTLKDLVEQPKSDELVENGVVDLDQKVVVQPTLETEDELKEREGAEQRHAEHVMEAIRSLFESLEGHHEHMVIIILNRLGGLSLKRIGEILLMSEGTVQNRLKEAAKIIGSHRSELG
jgi:DNA-directed RNA polymerase specialized sigma24 family protein